MNHEKALQYYASVLDDDLTIGANHLLDDLPTTFTATDFLYFFALRDRFWSDVADEEERLMTSAAMTECYLSAWLHIHSGDFRFNERVHDLEHCILYGDLLSGAFSEHLIALDKIGLLEQWLDLLQKINRELLAYSLEGRSTMEKKSCLVKRRCLERLLFLWRLCATVRRTHQGPHGPRALHCGHCVNRWIHEEFNAATKDKKYTQGSRC